MTRNNDTHDWWNEMNEDLQIPEPRRQASPKRSPLRPKRVQAELGADAAEQADREASFDFSYHAKLHERGWLINSLSNFYQAHWFDDILRLLKGGKEALGVPVCHTS